MKTTKLVAAIAGMWIGGVVIAQTVAVLEHPQCKETKERVVRPLFFFTPNGWHSLKSVHDTGRHVSSWRGLDASATPFVVETLKAPPIPKDDWVFVRDYFLTPQNASELPRLPNTRKKYAGWCEPPPNKPIVLVSANSPTPKRLQLETTQPDEVDKERILRALIKTYDSKRLCTNEEKPKPVRLRASDLVFEANIQMATGSRLVGVNLKRPVFECDSELGATDLPRWFSIAREVRYLGKAMELIDAIDVHSSGGATFFFWYSGYNEDGYVLLDQSLEKPVRYTWKYH
ncbi:MAG: hypothetical protein V4447_03860 [Pseudomonadota bacterium]